MTYKEYFKRFTDQELAELCLSLQDSIDYGCYGVRDVTLMDQGHQELIARGYDSIYEVMT